MKSTVFLLAIIILAVVGFYLFKPSVNEESIDIANLPWSITTDENKQSTVFGITLDKSSVNEALSVLGLEHDLGIIQVQGESPSLEAFYGHFKAGPIQGKLTLSFNSDEEQLISMIEAAANMEFTATGVRKYFLNSNDLEIVQEYTVRSISFVPAARLDESIIRARFGEPDNIVDVAEGQRHFLYPDTGVDIFLDEEGKDRIQYVAPNRFDDVLKPLQSIQSVE